MTAKNIERKQNIHVRLSKIKMMGKPCIIKLHSVYIMLDIFIVEVNLRPPNMRTSKQPDNTVYRVIDQNFFVLMVKNGFAKTNRIIINIVSVNNHIE